jgi:sugar lactone lactonase YvrE
VQARTAYLVLAILIAIGASTQIDGQPSSPDATTTGILDLALKTREARLAGDNAAWLRHGRETLQRAPEHPDLLVSTARALTANGRLDESLEYLRQAVERGAGFDPATLPEFKNVAGNDEFVALAAHARQNQSPIAPAEVFLVVENTEIQPEGIAWDPGGDRAFIGSLNGEIWQVTRDRRLARLAARDSGLREVLGLKVDPEKRLLWPATGVFPDPFAPAGEAKKDVGLTGVMAFNLDTGKPARSCWLDERPVLHGFNDLPLARNGDVFVSDSTANAIYRLSADGCRLERLMQDPRMGFPNGLALSEDESRLYVAHIEGLSSVDPATGRRSQLTVPANATVNSIDGLVRDGADLIGIQPSPYLARVIRIRLSDDGQAVREVNTVSSRPPAGVSQTTGTIAGAEYFSVAGTLDPLAQDPGSDRRARILRANLR